MRKSLIVVGIVSLVVGATYMSCGKGPDKGDDSDTTGKPGATDSATDTTTDTATSVAAGAVALETIQKIVQVTDPVVAYAVSDNSEDAVQARAFDVALKTALTAEKGVSFGKKTSEIAAAFGTDGSKAYCDSVNNAMKFFKEASTPDFNLCIFKTVATKGQAVKANQFQVWDFKIAAEEGTMTYRMKFKIEPAEDGTVKDFENFTCDAQGSNPAQQSGYVHQTTAGGVVNVHTRSRGDHGQGEYKIRADMETKVNAAGRPVGIKKIDYAEQGDAEGRKVRAKVRQATGNIEIIGYETSEAQEVRFVRFVELLDANEATGLYHVTKLGFGSGAALLRQVTGSSTADVTASWSGDTLKAAPSEERKSHVSGRESELIAAASDDRDIEFAAAETYDCQGAADYTFEGKYEDFAGCIGAYEIDQEGGTMCNAVAN